MLLLWSKTFFHFKNNSERCTKVFMQSTRYFCWILMKIKIFSRHISKQYSNIEFHENPSSGSRVIQYGQMDRQHT